MCEKIGEEEFEKIKLLPTNRKSISHMNVLNPRKSGDGNFHVLG